MWKKYLVAPAAVISLIMGAGIPLAFEAGLVEAGEPSGRLPYLLPTSICANPLIYLLLTAALIFACVKIGKGESPQSARAQLFICLGAVILSYAMAAWAARAYYDMALVFLSAIYLTSFVFMVPIATLGFLSCAIILAVRIRKTYPPKKPWD